MNVVRTQSTVPMTALRGGSVFQWNGSYYLKLNNPVLIQGDVRAFTAVTLGFDASLAAIDKSAQVTFIKGQFVEDVPK